MLIIQNTNKYNVLEEIIWKFKVHLILEIGNGWAPAVLDTEEEHDFVRISQKIYTNSASYFIGGSTNQTNPSARFNYGDYIANNSGTNYDIWWYFMVFDDYLGSERMSGLLIIL